jgi:hypothetical protein
MDSATKSEDLSWFTRLFRNTVFQQFALLTVFIIGGTVAGHFLGAALTNSLGSAMGVVIMITLIALPISYVMNHLFYHNRAMRLGGGVVASMFGPLTWLYITVKTLGAYMYDSEKIPYFGMFPLFGPAKPEIGKGSAFESLYGVWNELTQFFRYDIGRNVDFARSLLAAYWEPEVKKAVPESIYEQARGLAARAATDMAPFESLVGEPRQTKEAELATDRAAKRTVLGTELNRLLNGS